jgi:hypothetical protein
MPERILAIQCLLLKLALTLENQQINSLLGHSTL